MGVLDLSKISSKAALPTGRQSSGNRQKHIHDYVVKNSGKCDRDQISNVLFTNEFGKGPWEDDREDELVAKMTIYKKAVKVALGTNKASINRNDELSHTISEDDNGILKAVEKK